jgi:hypothetical protein
MTLSGTAYRRQPLAPRTSVTGCSPLLPTPRASLNEMRTTKRTPSQEAGTHGKYLTTELLSLLPTPSATEYGNNQSPSPNAAIRPSQEMRNTPGLPTTLRMLRTPTAAPHNQPGANGGENRKELVQLLPSPMAADATRGSTTYGRGNPMLRGALLESSGPNTSPPSADGNTPSDGLLENPCFREWLLGAPEGWSDPDCPLSVTEFRSKPDTSWDA